METGQRVKMDIKKYRCCLTKKEWTDLCSAWMQEYSDYRFVWPNASEAERIISANRRAEQFFKVLIARRMVHIHEDDLETLVECQELMRSET